MDVLTLGMMDFILEWEQDTALFAEECFARSKIMEEQRRWAIDALRLKARVDALMMATDSTNMPIPK
jgi:hypothetical protein